MSLDEWNAAERNLARLVALAYAADHPTPFTAMTPLNSTSIQRPINRQDCAKFDSSCLSPYMRKMKNSTDTRSDGARLCETCRWSSVIKGVANSEHIVFCDFIRRTIPLT